MRDQSVWSRTHARTYPAVTTHPLRGRCLPQLAAYKWSLRVTLLNVTYKPCSPPLVRHALQREPGPKGDQEHNATHHRDRRWLDGERGGSGCVVCGVVRFVRLCGALCLAWRRGPWCHATPHVSHHTAPEAPRGSPPAAPPNSRLPQSLNRRSIVRGCTPHGQSTPLGTRAVRCSLHPSNPGSTGSCRWCRCLGRCSHPGKVLKKSSRRP